MREFKSDLAQELAGIRAQGLHRQLCEVESPQSPRINVAGRSLLNLSSNDYLGLADHPRVKEGAIRAVERFGAGSGASRLVSGSLSPHFELEEALAEFKQTEAALSFSSGYATALGTISALVGPDDFIIIDRLVHASIVDAARLSGAKLRVFAHNDLNELEARLAWAAARTSTRAHSQTPRVPRILVVTESVFSMDGDRAPLREMVELKDKYGAWLMVDEAHATGLCGTSGRGWADAQNISARVEVHMGTLGKALGSAGGFVCGARELVDLLANRARSFIFSTAPVPAAAGAAIAAVRLVQGPEGTARREVLQRRIGELREGIATRLAQEPSAGGMATLGFHGSSERRFGGKSDAAESAIVPLIVGNEAEAVRLAVELRERGVFVPAIRFPTVARGQARLRVTVTASHIEAEVSEFLAALALCLRPVQA